MNERPSPDGVKDLPAVPGSLHKGSVPPLGPIGQVPDKNSADQCRGKA